MISHLVEDNRREDGQRRVVHKHKVRQEGPNSQDGVECPKERLGCDEVEGERAHDESWRHGDLNGHIRDVCELLLEGGGGHT
jgi:hypothetical protein